jgi:hypothetical protein
MSKAAAKYLRGSALTQSRNDSQRCANPFCEGEIEPKKRGRDNQRRYCSDRCRMDGYVLSRAKAMLREVGITEFVERLMEFEK